MTAEAGPGGRPGAEVLGFALAVAVRLLQAAALIAAVLLFNFLLVRLAPGDPALVIAGGMGGATEAMVEDLRRLHGLDRPLHGQLLAYAAQVASGDLGRSLHFGAPVLDLVQERLGPTLLLAAAALLVASVLGTLLGARAARRPHGAFAHVVSGIALAAWSAPAFLTGILLIYALSAAVPLFPLSGMTDLRAAAAGPGRALDLAHHLALPALTLALTQLAPFVRIARAVTLEALGADHVRTARAKGLGEGAVLYRHALRNAAVPIVTLAGLQCGALLSGAVIVETVFDWPGLGSLAFESALRRDHPTLLGILAFAAAAVVAVNLATDLACRLLDPRIRPDAPPGGGAP